MRILFVCMQYIHSARWINQLKDSHHEIYVFDCLDKPIHEDLTWTNTISGWKKRKRPYVKGEYFLNQKFPFLHDKIKHNFEVTATEKLIEVISEIKPDLVHSLEMQSETYPLSKVFDTIPFNWAYSCWGNDVFYYKDKPIHRKKLKKIFTQIKYNFLECKRDGQLIRSINPNSQIVATDFPGGGGYQLEEYMPYRKNLEIRTLILIKGYQHNFGRALNVLNAIELMADKVKDFEIYVYSAHKIVEQKISELNEKYSLNIEYSSRYDQISHEQLLEKFGKSVVAIGNNISDGVPNTLLEAVIMGAFPIQSNPGGASEDYIKHGENGYLIEDPNDIENISSLILDVINNKDLLKSAYQKNVSISQNLAYDKIKERVVKAYAQIEANL